VPNVAPDESLSGTLDYSKNDDRLVGILSTLNKRAPDTKTVLLTDDTGPAATADSLNLPFLMISEGWRRPAEETTEDKKIRDLEKDLAAYRAQEPKISIKCCAQADETGVVRVKDRRAEPLTATQIDELLAALQTKHPMRNDFGPIEPVASGDHSKPAIRFEPPNDEKINNYQKVLYPQWINECRSILSELHKGRDEVEDSIVLHWIMRNDGTRPATQVRVQFEAQGPLMISRVPDDEDEKIDGDGQSTSEVEPHVRFPSPPKPPAYTKVVDASPVAVRLTGGRPFDIAGLGQIRGLEGQFGALQNAMKGLDHLGGVSRLLENHSGLMRHLDIVDRPITPLNLGRYIPPKHDPERFYYDGLTRVPTKRGALTCDLWRHRGDEEVFDLEVFISEENNARGSVLCTVHAENLTKPETSRITVVREVDSFSLVDLAHRMVEQCV
jgi:hypothetical protein